MGWVKDAKASKLRDEARSAYARGQSVLMTVMKAPNTRPNWSGEVNDWSLMVQAVEAEGWTVESVSGTSAEVIVMYRRGRRDAMVPDMPSAAEVLDSPAYGMGRARVVPTLGAYDAP